MLHFIEGVSQRLDDGATLWRFMDFTKYVAMLHQKALFFARADEMPDPFEGLYGRRSRPDPSAHPRLKSLRERILLSCWHENEHESAAMWRIYLSAEDGVAVRTNVGRLKASLAAARDDIVLGRVRYEDPKRSAAPSNDELAPFFCKRKSFEYEQEVRALCRVDQASEKPGRYLSVDLGKLIEQVVVAPSGQAWLRDLVGSVTERYGLTVPIVASTMLDPPDADSCGEGAPA
jgi:hypothetical protein